MKKLIYAVMLLLGLSIFGSCSKEGGSIPSWIVGDWIGETVDGEAYPGDYVHFSKNGFCAFYEAYLGDGYWEYPDDECWFEKGTLYSTPEVRWEKDMELEYKIVDGTLVLAGAVVGSITKINNDKIIISGDSDLAGTLIRVRSFKTTDPKPEDPEEEEEEVDPVQPQNKRLVMCGDEWDKYAFTYATDGKIAKVSRNEGEITWTFTWSGAKAAVKRSEKGKQDASLSFTIGSNGFVSTYTDEYGDVRNCSYDKDGHLLKVDKGGNVCCNCIWEDGDLKEWSRFTNGAEQFKMQSFLAIDNIGGIFPDATDKAGLDRWMIELGLFGNPSNHLLDQAMWDGSGAISVYVYDMDAEGYVTKVTKVYDMGDPEYYFYAWEVVD